MLDPRPAGGEGRAGSEDSGALGRRGDADLGLPGSSGRAQELFIGSLGWGSSTETSALVRIPS